MSDEFGDKIHPATPRRRERARREGHVARSHDLAMAVMLLGGLLVLWWLGQNLTQFLGTFTRQQLGGQAWVAADADFAVGRWNATAYALGRVLLPVLGLVALLAAAGQLGQIGLLFLPHKLTADPQRVNPARGLERMFSGANLTRLALSVVKTVAVIAVTAGSLWAERQRLLAVGALEVGPLVALLAEVAFGTALKISLALVALGVVDYAYQRWKFERDLRMTTRELREEWKEEHGSPLVNQRRRQIQRELRQIATLKSR